MAETGRREVIGDVLAPNPRGVAPDRSLGTMAVRNPGLQGPRIDNSIGNAIAGLGQAVAGVLKEKEEDWTSEGKLQFMQGATEDAIAQTGNKWTMQGWQAMNAADKANRWYAEELNAIQNGAMEQDPAAYNEGLMKRRAAAMGELPDDPAIRKLFVAAFDDIGPRLTMAQTTANNTYNQEQTVNNFRSLIGSGSYANADAPRAEPGQPLKLSAGKVRTTVSGYTDNDVNLMTRAVMGEALGEGAGGQAAVAHNILNRVIDGGFGGKSIKGVVLKKGAYSAMNAITGYIGGKGSNHLVNYNESSPAFQRTKKVVQDVLSGRHVDPTQGSTHYVSGGIRPKWWNKVQAQGGGTITRYGNHEFIGRARNLEQHDIPSEAYVDPFVNAQGSKDVVDVPSDQTIIADPASDAQEVSDAAKIPTNATPSPPQTQTQDLILNHPMPRKAKATATAQEMATQLQMGETALWDNVGGISFLQRLGATPQEIRQVQAARMSYEKEQTNKFNAEEDLADAAEIERVKKGEITLEEFGANVQAKYDGKQMTESRARGQISKAVAAANAENRQPNMDPHLQRALANTYAAIRQDPETYTAEWADAHINWLATRYSIPAQQLTSTLAQVWSTEAQAKKDLITAGAQAAKKKAEDDAKMDQVNAAIRTGTGMDNLTGSLNGVPLKEVAIQKQFQEMLEDAIVEVPNYIKSGLTVEEATRKAQGVAEDMQWRQLHAQGGVVNDGLAGSITNGLSGSLVDHTGAVDKSAHEAMDTYMRLKEVDNTGAYAAKYFKNDQARDMAMLVESFADGGFDLESAIRKAHEVRSTGINSRDDVVDIRKTTDFNRKLNTHMKANFDGLMGPDGWFERSKISLGEKNFVMNNPAALDQLKTGIANKAWAYLAMTPNADPDMIIKKAAQDMINDSVIVGGNVLTPRASGGTPLIEQMGLRFKDDQGNVKSYPQDAVNEAIQMKVDSWAREQVDNLAKGLPDPTGWGLAYRDRMNASVGSYGLAGFASGGAVGAGEFRSPSELPPFHASWDQDAGTIVIQLYDTPDRASPVPVETARPIYLDLAQVGADYRKFKENQGSNIFQRAWRDLWATGGFEDALGL